MTDQITASTAPSRLQLLLGEKTVLCDGAMGTTLYERGVFINRCYDELNLSQPELIRGIHEEYLLAGATLIETNTFGANRFRLARFGLEDQAAAINLAGAKLARQAVEQLADKQAGQAWVAGSIGPLGVKLAPAGGELGVDPETRSEKSPTVITPDVARAAYAAQVRALAEGGVDILLIETVMSLAEAEQALLAVREAAPHIPVAVMVTVDEESLCLDGARLETAAARLAGWGADGVGVNCSTGPAAVLAAIESMAAATHLPLFAMPNAGMPRSIDGRHIYLCSPEYTASYARKFLKAGVQFIGGCCGTTPAHIRAMKSSLRAEQAQQNSLSTEAKVTVESEVAPPPLAERSTLGRLIAEGSFVTMVEIVPPRGVNTARELAGARLLASHGVDIINIPDSPRASARMSAQSLCIQIQQQCGIETLVHYTCRDRNVLSIQSDLLGASSIGLRNILCLTGDPPKLGNYPDATAVFDVDAIGLVNMVRRLNHGLDIGGNSIKETTGFTVGVAANPGVADIENEIRRFAFKVEAGAEYAITQPVFDLRLLESFLRRVEAFRIPVIAGIWPLTSLRNAEFMKNDLKVAVPDEIMLRMQAAATPDAAREEGVRIAQEMLATAQPMVQGVQVSAPFGRYGLAVEVLSAVLEERAATASR
jgi:homocysteine S-methyltransferase